MKARVWMAVVTIAALISAPLSHAASEKIGIFETILESSGSFSETTDALESAIDTSGLVLHGSHDVRVPDGAHERACGCGDDEYCNDAGECEALVGKR